MRKSFTILFNEGEAVYLKTEPEVDRVISGYLIRGKSVVYGLKEGECESWHLDYEIERIKKRVIVKGFK